jgi:hypothetical protein
MQFVNQFALVFFAACVLLLAQAQERKKGSGVDSRQSLLCLFARKGRETRRSICGLPPWRAAGKLRA